MQELKQIYKAIKKGTLTESDFIVWIKELDFSHKGKYKVQSIQDSCCVCSREVSFDKDYPTCRDQCRFALVKYAYLLGDGKVELTKNHKEIKERFNKHKKKCTK